ncbi:MAG: hypothetical protein IPK88_19205 [Saprospiraceae bacterium]|nr:hypothetical protein [Candidatus Defluviibacterium haderslevense]
MKEILIPLSIIPDEQEFYRGAIFRIYKVDIPNVKKEDEDFYDYMLIDLNDSKKMLLANVSSKAGKGKAGLSLGYVEKLIDVNRSVVTGKEMKRYLNEPLVYWVEE